MKIDLNTPAGIRALADHLETIATDYPDKFTRENHLQLTFGPLSIHGTESAIMTAAALIRKKAPQAGSRKNKFGTASAFNPLDQALRLYGTERNALETITRHLETMRDDIDPEVAKRARKLCAEISRGHYVRPASSRHYNGRKWIDCTIPGAWFVDMGTARTYGRAERQFTTAEVEMLEKQGLVLNWHDRPQATENTLAA